MHGEVWICSISKAMPISIGRGENRGREITYHNVVRNLLKVGDWNGSSGSWTVPLENISREGVDAAVVYVQDGNRDKPGAMLGAAYHVAALSSAFGFCRSGCANRSGNAAQSAPHEPGINAHRSGSTSAMRDPEGWPRHTPKNKKDQLSLVQCRG